MGGSEFNGGDAFAILDLVESMSAARGVDDHATIAMAGIAELVPCIEVCYIEMVPAEGRVRWRVTPDRGDLLEEFAPLFGQLMRQNPLVRRFEEAGDTRTLMWSDFVSPQELAHTALYQQMFRQLGVESQMAVTLPAPPGVVVGFAVNGDRTGFSERDRAVLNRLRPHLAHTYRVALLRDHLSTAGSFDDDLGWIGALAGDDGIVKAVTDNAGAIESVAGIRATAGGPLSGALRSWFVAGITSYDASHPAFQSPPQRVSSEAEGVAGWHVPSPDEPHLVFVLTRVDAAARRLAHTGLTQRQIEVALELCEGGTNAVIARRLDIAEGTLRKHLERIYQALGVSDRASAIAHIRGW